MFLIALASLLYCRTSQRQLQRTRRNPFKPQLDGSASSSQTHTNRTTAPRIGLPINSLRKRTIGIVTMTFQFAGKKWVRKVSGSICQLHPGPYHQKSLPHPPHPQFHVFWGGAVGHSTQNQQLKESSYVPISKLWTRKTATLCSEMPRKHRFSCSFAVFLNQKVGGIVKATCRICSPNATLRLRKLRLYRTCPTTSAHKLLQRVPAESGA